VEFSIKINGKRPCEMKKPLKTVKVCVTYFLKWVFTTYTLTLLKEQNQCYGSGQLLTDRYLKKFSTKFLLAFFCGNMLLKVPVTVLMNLKVKQGIP
jgi:hypothetical protein